MLWLAFPADANTDKRLYKSAIDRQNTLWIGADGGVVRFDLATEKVLPLPNALSLLPKDTMSYPFIDSLIFLITIFLLLPMMRVGYGWVR
jgi:ligand-binding sensor domain-containing protein